MNRFSLRSGSGSKGQSFVELSLVVLLLMMLVVGIAEFGVLLNRYLNLLDGVREAARYGANYDPFAACAPDQYGVVHGTVDSDGICSDYYQSSAQEATAVISPIVLNPSLNANPALNDDIVISIAVLANGNFCRYPTTGSGQDGWSWSKNVMGLASPNHISVQNNAFIQSRMDATAPEVSLVLVEIFYNYPQTLKAPFYEQVFPDPVPVYIYAIMPLKNANPPSGISHV